jgi:3-hydroxypropanoate dehydrogenase
MSAPLPDAALNQLFRDARTRNGWDPAPLPETTLRAVYDLARMGPTSANASPARFVFVTSEAGKKTLAAAASAQNAPKILQAPCTVIIGYDLEFMDLLPTLFPHNPGAKDWFAKGSEVAQATAFRNGTLQGAYLIMAARSLGLDCGPMSGFSLDAVDAAFFPGTSVKTNFICSLGHGTDENLFPRSPRLSFEEAARFA